MNKKNRIFTLCLLTSIAVVISLSVMFYNKNNNTKPVANNNNNCITDISSYNKKIKIDINAHLPSAKILNKEGNGLQLYDAKGNFIDGNFTLDCSKQLNVFLSIIWLEKQTSDLSLVVLVDNHVQQFQVDDKKEKQTILNLNIQPKSFTNIPLSIEAIGDNTINNSTITFLLLYNDIHRNISTEDSMPNATNKLIYRIDNCERRDYKSETLLADDFVNQNNNNSDLIKTKSFYSVLSSKNNKDFTFYQENQLLNITNKQYYFYAMGLGNYTTFMFLENKVISPFENKSYLSYVLDEKSYLKQKVAFNTNKEICNRLTIINIDQNQKQPRYSVVCHNLSK